jgi:hypothetical protein
MFEDPYKIFTVHPSPVLFTQRIDGITAPLPTTTPFDVTTSFPQKRESSPGADHAIKISPPGIGLLHPPWLPGSLPFPELLFPGDGMDRQAKLT